MACIRQGTNFPKSWDVLDFEVAIRDVTGGNAKIKQGDVLEIGKYPVIDQGKSSECGYVNDEHLLCNEELPAILFGDHTKIFKYVTRPFVLGADGVKVLSPRATLDKRFLFHFLNTLALPDNAGYSRHYKFLKEAKIPVPPLSEQKRIAAILDKADAIRRKRQQAIQLADDFLRAVFLDMFGDPVTNPKGWNENLLSELCLEKMNNGIFKKNDEYGEGLPVAWVSELFGNHQITFSEKTNFISATRKEVDKYGLYYGDILFCRSSLKLEGIGWNNVYFGEEKQALFECHLIRMRPKLDCINPVFLNYQLRLPGIRARVFSQAKTVTMTTIDQDGIGKVKVIVPEKALQDRFEVLFRKTINYINRTKGNNDLDALFMSLSQKAFSGVL